MIRQHYSSDSAESLLEAPEVLAVIQFDRECAPSGSAGLIPVGLSSLAHHRMEVIEAPGAVVNRGIDEGCYWSSTDNIMFSAVWISPDDCRDIERSAEKAYSSLLKHIRQKGFPHPFRIWNFISDINVGPGDREEYKKFCAGRLRAYTLSGLLPEAFPAASALGHHGSGAVIYALSSKSEGVHYENPRQERAYRYPREYGLSSPSFSRATGIELKQERWVFISGTASILGHETQCPGDLKQQLQTTVENIHVLCDHICKNRGELSALRVYLRHRSDLECAKAFMEAQYPNSDINYLYADICRSNLLVEIEAAFTEFAG